MKTICIAGKNDIACMICGKALDMFLEREDIRVVASLTRGDDGTNGWQRSYRAFCEKNRVEVLTLEDLYEVKHLYFFSTEYDRIVKPDRFSDAKLFNIHFSLLPAYKGILPSVLPVLNGEQKSGVTLHVVRSGIDTGEIIDQEECDIEDEAFSIDFYNKLSGIGARLVTKWIPDIIEDRYECTPQPSKGSSYFGRGAVDYSKLSLNTNATAFQVRNQIRAFCFRPYQMLTWKDYKLLDCRITDCVSTQKPGTILFESKTELVVSTIDYDVVLYKDVLSDLLCAIEEGRNEQAKTLLSTKRLLRDYDKLHGWTPLIIAVYNNNKEMVEWLLSKGADINDKNYSGTNLLMYAKDCFLNTGDASIFKLLRKLGLSEYESDYSGKNLLDYLSEEQREKIDNIL